MGGLSMELPKRKRIRLEGFDYASSGGYFVTLCLAGRRPLLWEDGQGRGASPEAPPELSRIGKIGAGNPEVERAFQAGPD